MWRADTVLGAATAAAGVVLAVLSLGIDSTATQSTLSARFLPLVLAAALVGLGVLLALRPGEQRLAEVVDLLLVRRALWLAAAVAVYFTTFRDVDFRLGTWAFMLCAMWVLGARRRAELIVVPPAVALAVYVTFRYGFDVLLPTWT
jgi:putative tricarboxylic transport membrane protein